MDKEINLVKRAQQGDKLAFGELVLTHQTFVYNLALKVMENPLDAQDLAQETFLKAWLALPRFRQDAQFRTWLYRIIMNLCFNRRPRLKHDLEQLSIEGSEDFMVQSSAADPAKEIEVKQVHAFLHQKVKDMPEIYQILIQMRYQQGLAYDEIAVIMDIPLGTVKTGLFRAHAQLRQALQTEEVLWTH